MIPRRLFETARVEDRLHGWVSVVRRLLVDITTGIAYAWRMANATRREADV